MIYIGAVIWMFFIWCFLRTCKKEIPSPLPMDAWEAPEDFRHVNELLHDKLLAAGGSE